MLNKQLMSYKYHIRGFPLSSCLCIIARWLNLALEVKMLPARKAATRVMEKTGITIPILNGIEIYEQKNIKKESGR